MTSPALVFALAVASAASPEILAPPWPLSADGDLVAVRGGAPLAAAEGAKVERVAPGLFRVVPERGSASVALEAGGARATLPVEPPPGAIRIDVTPAAPVKGRDREIRIEVAVATALGEPDPAPEPPRIVASSGRVRDLVPGGPGRFRGVYEPAPTRYPEVGVLLALAPRCPACATPRAVGYAIVPLSAAIDLPAQAEPGARTTIAVGGRTFGPVTAPRTGRFSIPIEVAPGARFGRATTVDATGNRRTTEVDLRLPDVDALACAAWPAAVAADGLGEAGVWCVASTPAGAPARGARIVLRASAGEVDGPAPFRDALQRARFRAPRGGGGKEAVLSAAYPEGGQASRDEIPVRLATGGPAEISVALAADPVPLGATVGVESSVKDSRGDAIGVPHGPPGATEGFVAPDRFVARKEPGDFTQDARLAFALSPGSEATALTLRRDGAAWVADARTVDGRPAAGVPLRFGSGAEAVTDGRGAARVAAQGPRESVVARGGARAPGWEGIAPPPAPPFEIERTVRVKLRPPSAVDVVAWIEGRTLRWRVEDPERRPLPGRAVALRSGAVVLGPVERDAAGERAEIRGGGGAVAVVDVATGVAAVVVAP